MIEFGEWAVSINRLLQDSAFEAEQIDRIEAAYKQVLHALRLTNRINPLTEIVAEKIFGIAQAGEVGTAHITELTLKEFQNALVADPEPENDLNRRAKELRRVATAGLSDGEALAALGTAFGEEVATMVARHPRASLVEILDVVFSCIRQNARTRLDAGIGFDRETDR
jgi:hypothetical protein